MSQKIIRPFYLDITPKDRDDLHRALDDILDSGTLILGRYTDEFEKAFAAYVGTKYAVSLNSATSALEIQLRLADVVDRKVAVPTNTNFATVAAIIHAGGKPVFLDMDASTFMPTLAMLEGAHRNHPDLAGFVCVHIGGVIAPDMLEIVEYCGRAGLFLVEDCAHAHGSVLQRKHAGTFGVSGAFSFFPTKVMTTMEGGMIVSDDEEYAAAVRSYRNQGKRAGNYNSLHVDLGNSWRMSEFAAAFGLSQLKKLDAMLDRRGSIAKVYVDCFESAGIAYVSTGHMDRCSNYKVIAVLPSADVDLKSELAKDDIVLGGAVYDVPCHRQPVFSALSEQNAPCPVSEQMCPRQFCLPITSGMDVNDAHRVANAVKRILQRSPS